MNGLLIIFLIAMLVTVVGFKMYVYFFSVGYGFSIAGIGIAMLVLFRENLTTLTVLMCALLIVYGLRLGGYLLIRELKSTAYKKLLKTESDYNEALKRIEELFDAEFGNFSHKRNLSISMIRKLMAGLRIPAEILLGASVG